MIELFVENQPVDVNKSFSTLMTYAIDDIRDFGAKNTAFSKTIILPGTKRNNALFGNIFDVSGSNDYDPTVTNKGINFNAAISAQAYIFSDNIQLFKGILRVLEVIDDNGSIEYEVSVFGELGGFAAKLGNLKLEDLDFSAYNHAYTVPNITASWDNANAGAGYYYPLIDHGNYSAAKHNWKYKTFRPALFVKQYIDKIFANAGYSYDSALFLTDRFKRMIVPNNSKAIYSKSQDLVTATDPNPPSFSLFGGSYQPFNYFGFFSVVLSSNFSTLDNKKFTYIGTPSIQVELKFRVSGTFRGNQSYFINIYKNLSTYIGGAILPPSAGYVPFDKEISATITLNTGDYFNLYGVIGADPALSYNINFGATYEFTIKSSANELAELNLGDTVDINTNLPKNILQKDLVSSIVKLWNLYIFEDPENDKVLKIMPFVDFFANTSSVDWSLKLDRSKPIRIKPMSELNARYYAFKFKDDTDFYNDLYKKRYSEGYGNYVYDSEYEFAKETETVDVIFSGTPIVGYTGEDKVYSTIFKRSGNTLGAGEESVDSNIRILQAKKIIGVTSWNITEDSGAILSSQTVYGYAGHFDSPDAPANDIQFGVPKELFFTLVTGAINANQFNVYWSSYMAEITDKDSKLLTGTFKLNFKDIYQLDFSKLVYIDGSLFRLNKVIDFNATNEDVCTCEVLKVINLNYNGANSFIPVSWIMTENGADFRDNNIQFVNRDSLSEIDHIYIAGSGNIVALPIGTPVIARQTYFGGIGTTPVWSSNVRAVIKLFINNIEDQSVTADFPSGYAITGVLGAQKVVFVITEGNSYRVESSITAI